MKKTLSIFLVGILAVTLLDSIGSIASRQMSFNYSLLSIVSFIVYVGFAFFLARQADKNTQAPQSILTHIFAKLNK